MAPRDRLPQFSDDPVAAPDLRPGITVPVHLATGPLAPGSVPARRPG